VPDAQYFRSQAELYFSLARRMSLDADAKFFSALAERCLACAIEVDGKTQPAGRAAADRPAL
jgi:hypothetical protein